MADGDVLNGRNREELLWSLFRTFFRSREKFLTLFDRYEERVLAFASRFNTHRSRLKLPVDELLTVLDFKRLEELRDHEIVKLKEIAHELFRGPDSTDLFDHHVSNIYHEISMLKEEHYTLREDFVRRDPKEYDRFFREVSEFYPKRLRHLRNLYGAALRRLEKLLPTFSRATILIRSLYLFGEELLAASYPRGRLGLYRKMYPEIGEVEAYAVAGESFLASGFEEEALGAFQKALQATGTKRARRRGEPVEARKAEIQAHLEDLESRLADDGAVPSSA